MKRFTYLLVLFFSVQAAQAQRCGIKGGMNFSNVEGVSASTNSRSAFQGGLVAEFNLCRILYLNTGMLYSEKGYEHPGGAILSEKWNYVELPLNLAYKFKASKLLNVFVQAGPYAGYLVNSKADMNPAVNFVDWFEVKRKKTDYGVGFGTGVELGPLVAGLNYHRGMMNLNGSP